MEGVGITRVTKGNIMKVFVVFDFPDIIDVNSEQADNIIECLEIDLKNSMGDGRSDSDYQWYIDDAEGGVK
jgi:hypothetical protein